MDYLLHALFRHSGQLPGPPSTVTDVERFYRTRIPLDRYALRNYTAIFSIIYAIANLFAGCFVDWLGSKKGYLWAIAIWSLGACLHALCGWATEMSLGLKDVNEMIAASGALTSTIAITSVYYFIAARIVLAVGESGNFPAAIKVTAEYFPKKDRAFATSIFNAGSTIGALIAPVSIPPLASYFKSIGVGNGWEMAFIVIGALGFIWMGLWMFMYKKPQENPQVNAAELAYIQQDKEKKKQTLTRKTSLKSPSGNASSSVRPGPLSLENS